MRRKYFKLAVMRKTLYFKASQAKPTEEFSYTIHFDSLHLTYKETYFWHLVLKQQKLPLEFNFMNLYCAPIFKPLAF